MSGLFGCIKLFVLGALVGALVVLVASGIFGLSFEVSLLVGVALSAMALIWLPEMLTQREST
jgi:Flp pilus assembly protein TadB